MIKSFCLPDEAVIHPPVIVCVQVCVYICVCLRVNALESLAEREYPSDRGAKPRYITVQTTTAPFWERCTGFERIFAGARYVLFSVM